MCSDNFSHPQRSARRFGFTLIELLVVIAIVSILIGLLLPAVQKVREAANQTICQNNLHQIGVALHAYHDNNKNFPPGYRNDTTDGDIADTSPGWGWAAYLLPYIEQDPLFKSFNFNLPIEHPENGFRTTVLEVYVCPSDLYTGVFTVQDMSGKPLADAATNSYAASHGVGASMSDFNGLFNRNSKVRIRDVTDGTSNTIAVGERAAWQTQTAWAGAVSHGVTRFTDKNGKKYPPGGYIAPTEALVFVTVSSLNGPASQPEDFWSPHVTRGMFLYADASVRAMNVGVDVHVLQALVTRNGGEVVNFDDF